MSKEVRLVISLRGDVWKEKDSGLGSAFRMIKRYLAYQAEQPFAAIFGTELFLSNHVDLKNMLCA